MPGWPGWLAWLAGLAGWLGWLDWLGWMRGCGKSHTLDALKRSADFMVDRGVDFRIV